MTKPAPKFKKKGAGANTVGLIVEGDAEFASFPLLHSRGLVPGCPPLKPYNLGGVGSEVAPVGVAKRVAPQVIQHRVSGRTRVVVCIDREQRTDCAPAFAKSVLDALVAELGAKNHPVGDLHVVIADRAFEAWLIAGWEGLAKQGRFVKGPKRVCFEGELGQQQKKGVVELSQLLGRDYHKTKDGPSLFAALNFAQARDHGQGKSGSRSLDKFLRSIGV